MRGFRLYHPGDRSAAIVPRVGLFRQKNTATEPDSSNGSAPPHIGEAQLTGRSLGTAARRAPAVLKPLDIRPGETPKPQYLVSPETTTARCCGQVPGVIS